MKRIKMAVAGMVLALALGVTAGAQTNTFLQSTEAYFTQTDTNSATFAAPWQFTVGNDFISGTSSERPGQSPAALGR